MGSGIKLPEFEPWPLMVTGHIFPVLCDFIPGHIIPLRWFLILKMREAITYLNGLLCDLSKIRYLAWFRVGAE